LASNFNTTAELGINFFMNKLILTLGILLSSFLAHGNTYTGTFVGDGSQLTNVNSGASNPTGTLTNNTTGSASTATNLVGILPLSQLPYAVVTNNASAVILGNNFALQDSSSSVGMTLQQNFGGSGSTNLIASSAAGIQFSKPDGSPVNLIATFTGNVIGNVTYATNAGTATNVSNIAQFIDPIPSSNLYGWVLDSDGLGGPTNGLFIAVTNDPLLAIAPKGRLALTFPAGWLISAPKMMRYFSNSIPLKYICSFQAVTNGGGDWVAGFTATTDLTNWTAPVIVDVGQPLATNAQWGPNVFEGPSNDLHYSFAGIESTSLRYAYVVDLPNPNDLRQWANLRRLNGVVNNTTGDCPGGALICYDADARLWLAYSTTDNTLAGQNPIYGNGDLSADGWKVLGYTGIVGSGPTMVHIGGGFLLYYSYGGNYAYSTNRLAWTSQTFLASPINVNEGGLFEVGAYTNMVAANTTSISASQMRSPSVIGDVVSANHVGGESGFFRTLQSETTTLGGGIGVINHNGFTFTDPNFNNTLSWGSDLHVTGGNGGEAWIYGDQFQGGGAYLTGITAAQVGADPAGTAAATTNGLATITYVTSRLNYNAITNPPTLGTASTVSSNTVHQ